MRKFYLFVPMFAALAVGCGDDKPNIPLPADGPSLSVEVDDVQRTQVSFELTTDKGIDYAYAVLPANAPAPASAEALFADVTAHTGMFETPTVAIDYLGIAANNDYTLYAAARTINPFVYSELRSESFDTRFEYTDAITLDAITRNSFAYHIKPEAVGQYRHLCLKKSDYDWFVRSMGVTAGMYVGTFGFFGDEEQTYSYTDAYQDERGYPVYIHSDTEYIILYGMCDPANPGTKVLSTQTVTFRTVRVDESPYGVAIVADNVTSTGAEVRISPDEGIERFRVLVGTTADFDGIRIEGESALRGSIIGDPTDRSREYTSATTIPVKGLIPDTEYSVGVVGFDAQNREKVVIATFNTTSPTGPAPTIVPEPQPVDEPWHQVALNLKVEHAVNVWVCLNTREQYDKVLQQPGFTGTMGDIIKNNGILLTPEQLAQAKAGGVLCQSDALTPYTEYIYGFYAVNEELVTTTETYEFRTGAAPAVDLRMQLVGDYQAEIYDDLGVRNFGVSVSEGPSEALKSDYASKNQLAILGFEPCQVDYHSPQDLLDKGWAASEQEANTNYGPKIILEVNQDGTVNTGGKNPATSELDFIMADYNGTKLYFMGYGKTANGQIMSSQQCFPVEVSEDRNTITIKGQTGVVFGSETIMYYPGVYQGDNPWYGGTDLFQGMSDLVLTRIQAVPSASGCVRSGVAAQLVVPHCVRLDLSERAGEQRPRMQMMHLFSSYR